MGSYHIADIDLKKGECHDRTKDSPPQMEQRDNQPHGILVNGKAEQGWVLEDIQENRFVFQKTEPQYREYFLPCLGWLYRGKVAERLSQIDILCNTRYGTDLRMKRRFVEIDVSKVNQNIAPVVSKTLPYLQK